MRDKKFVATLVILGVAVCVFGVAVLTNSVGLAFGDFFFLVGIWVGVVVAP